MTPQSVLSAAMIPTERAGGQAGRRAGGQAGRQAGTHSCYDTIGLVRLWVT